MLEAIRKAVSTSSEVQAALLFGSHATGRARAESDVDVAVLLQAAPTSTNRKQLLMSLAGALGKELGSDRLDLVLLNDAPPKLAFHVLKHGIVAFDRDSGVSAEAARPS